jgi:hypothetical protein
MTPFIPKRYLPAQLSEKDRRRQMRGIENSRRLYRKGIYVPRPQVTFKSKPSRHIARAKALFGVENILPTRELAKATGCPLAVLKGIVKKGEGAYYSGGSRPNQTAQSWGIARLASALTGGNASKVDFHLLRKCNPTKKAYRYAIKPKGLSKGIPKKD